MRRVQWFEFEDLDAVPAAVRNGGTDLLDLGFDRLGFYDGVAASPAVRKLPLPLAPLAMCANMAGLFVATLIATPFVRPIRLSRFALTYALPAIPALVAWDGTVSALRAYAPDELLALAHSAPGAEGYDWDAGTSGSALYLIGTPR